VAKEGVDCGLKFGILVKKIISLKQKFYVERRKIRLAGREISAFHGEFAVQNLKIILIHVSADQKVVSLWFLHYQFSRSWKLSKSLFVSTN
jgi:hypothetical protein